MSCVCIRYHLVATGLVRVWGNSTRAVILAPARAGGEEHFLKTNDAQDIGIHSFISKISSDITASGGAAKKPKTNNSADCLERIQAEGHNSKARGDRIFAAGYAKGFAGGKESGCVLGLAERIDKGRLSAAHANALEIVSLKATNEAVHKQLCNILEQSNGVATGQFFATQTASDLVVENRKLPNNDTTPNNDTGTLQRDIPQWTIDWNRIECQLQRWQRIRWMILFSKKTWIFYFYNLFPPVYCKL
jgi:hypothetical protein